MNWDINTLKNKLTEPELRVSWKGSKNAETLRQSMFSINRLFAENFTQFPREEIVELKTGDGRDIFKIIFYCPEYSDLGEPQRQQQTVLNILSGVLSNYGFEIKQDEYGLEAVVENAPEHINRWVEMANDIFEMRREKILSFTPEFR